MRVRDSDVPLLRIGDHGNTIFGNDDGSVSNRGDGRVVDCIVSNSAANSAGRFRVAVDLVLVADARLLGDFIYFRGNIRCRDWADDRKWGPEQQLIDKAVTETGRGADQIHRV